MNNDEKTIVALHIYGKMTQREAKLRFVLRSLVMAFLCFIVVICVVLPFSYGFTLMNTFLSVFYPVICGFVLVIMIKNHLLLMIRIKISDDQFSLEVTNEGNMTNQILTFKSMTYKLVTYAKP